MLASDAASVTTAARIFYNRAKLHGGGMAIQEHSLLHLTRGSEIHDNMADVHGGGIYSAGVYLLFGKLIVS